MAVPKNYDDFIFVKHNDTKIEQSKSLFFPKIKKIYERMHFSFLIDRAEWVSEWEEKTKKEERNSRRMKEISQTSFYSFGALLRSPRKKKQKKIFKGDETLVFRSRVSECARVRASSWCGIHTFLFLHSLSLSLYSQRCISSFLFKKSFCLSEILPFPRKKRSKNINVEEIKKREWFLHENLQPLAIKITHIIITLVSEKEGEREGRTSMSELLHEKSLSDADPICMYILRWMVCENQTLIQSL